MRERLIQTALVVASSAIALGAVQLYLVHFYPIRAAIYQLDDRLLYKLIPDNRHMYFREPGNGGGRVIVETDLHGYRPTGTRGKPRIAVYGDSFIMGAFSSVEDTFSARLGVELGAETINAGVAGYGPDQSALRIEQEIETLQPDLIVVATYVGNDYGDLTRNRLFRIGPDGALIENHPEVAKRIQESFAEAIAFARRPALVRAVFAAYESITAPHAPPIDLAKELEDSVEAQRKDWADFDRGDNVAKGFFRDVYDADIALEPESPSAQWKARAMSGVLARIDRAVKAHGKKWMLVIIPCPVDVAYQYDMSIDRAKHPTYAPERLTTLTASIAAKNGIDHVNLFEALKEKPGERFFFRFGDDHWTPAGQAKAAKLVAAAIKAGASSRQ
jgi:hypothetical protein